MWDTFIFIDNNEYRKTFDQWVGSRSEAIHLLDRF